MLLKEDFATTRASQNPTEKASPIRDTEIPALAYAIPAFTGLAFGWLLAVVLAHVIRIPAGHFPPGIIGWAVLHHYSKRQEAVIYGAALAGVCACVTFSCLWFRWTCTRLSDRGVATSTACWSSAIAFLPGLAVFLAYLPSGGVLVDSLLLPQALLLTVAAHAVALFALPRFASSASRRNTNKNSALEEPERSAIADRVLLLLPVVSVLFGGASWGWMLPFAIPVPHIADIVAQGWIWLIVAAVVAYALLVRFLIKRWAVSLGTSLRLATYPYLPSVLLWVLPLFWSSVALRLEIAIASAGLSIAALIATTRFATDLPVPANSVLTLWCGVFLGAYAGINDFLWDPTSVHGQFLTTLDGEMGLSWLSDGLHGRVPFRDFFYPYGLLKYYQDLWFVRTHSLDSFVSAEDSTHAFVCMFLATCIMGVLLRWKPSVLLFAPLLFAVSWLNLRVLLGVFAVAIVILAARRASRSITALAGALLVVSALYSPEVGTAAFLATAVCLALSAIMQRAIRVAIESMTWLAAGASTIAIPFLAVAAYTGVLLPWLSVTRSFLGSISVCCSMPFPALQPESGPWSWLGYGSTLLVFYSGPLIISIAAAVLIARIARQGSLRTGDVSLATLLVFASVVFASALSGADASHAEFALLPTFAIAFMLSDDALRRAASLVQRGSRSVLSLSVRTLESVLCLLFVTVLLFGILHLQERVPAGLKGPIGLYSGYENMIVRRDAAIRAVSRRTVPPGWRAVEGANGLFYFLSGPEAADVAPVLGYLETHMIAGDTVLGIPFAARYPVLLDLPSAIAWGQEFWSGAATPQFRSKIVAQLRANPPRYIVYTESETPDIRGLPWTDRDLSVADFILEHYRVVRQFGSALILERREGMPPESLQTGSLLSMPFLERGWYYPTVGTAAHYRWTAQTATARLTQLPSDRTLRVTLLAFPPEFEASGPRILSIQVDGHAVLRKNVGEFEQSPAQAPRQYTLSIPIDKVFHPTVRSVKFEVSKPFAAPSDVRILGVAIVQFGFTRH